MIKKFLKVILLLPFTFSILLFGLILIFTTCVDQLFLLLLVISFVLSVGLVWKFNEKINYKVIIVGLLTILVFSIWLTSLNASRTISVEGQIKASVSSIRAHAEIYYDANSDSYSGMCESSDALALLNNGKQTKSFGKKTDCRGLLWSFISNSKDNNRPDINLARQKECRATDSEYLVNVELPILYAPDYVQRYFCIDDTGNAIEHTNSMIEGFDCPKK